METLDFMKIITGEEPISYFDEFTEKWKKNMNLENVLIKNTLLFLQYKYQKRQSFKYL
ncbi:MAG: hypothetical protein V8R80_12255 [Eubacterium sp.]